MSDPIGARFVACKAWRWMDRMLDDRGRTVLCVGAGRIEGIPVEWCSASGGHFEDYESPERAKEAWGAATPDTTDPATLGCILALVREAWGDPWLHLAPMIWTRMTKVWAVLDGEGDVVNVADMPLHGLTEAEALLAALESAP